MRKTLKMLKEDVISCRRCPRLVNYRETAPILPIYEDEIYWRKPVPGYGDPKAWLLITGLAPAPQGGNRTGRPFTGDKSGRFLIKSLHSVNLANQTTSEYFNDGLKLLGCYMTAAVKCVPPDNKPTTQEALNCMSYYVNELYLLKNVKCVLALGKFAFDVYRFFLKTKGVDVRLVRFKHGLSYTFNGWPTLYGCFHPSPRNTNTGRLTEVMFTSLLARIKAENQI